MINEKYNLTESNNDMWRSSGLSTQTGGVPVLILREGSGRSRFSKSRKSIFNLAYSAKK
jgi:hypothetical protein